MLVAISAENSQQDSPMDSRFGRAYWFHCYNTESGEWSVLDNSANAEAAGSAGIKTSGLVHKSGAKVIISGRFGPKASDALGSFGIEAFESPEGTVSEVLEAWKNGELKKVL